VKGNKSSIPELGATIVLAVIASTILGILLWFSDRGLGMKDEGQLLVVSQYPDSLLATVTDYFDYNAILFSLLHSIVFLRVAGVVLLLGSSALLAFGFSRWLKLNSVVGSVPAFSLWLFCTIGSLFHYCYWCSTINYNTYNAVASSSALGMVFLALAPLSENSSKNHLCGFWSMFACGIFIGFEFFIKFPSAILMAGICGLLACLSSESWQTKGRLLFYFVAGFLMWCALHFLFIRSVASVFRSALINLSAQNALGHNANLISHYIHDVSRILGEDACVYWPIFLAVTIAFMIAEGMRVSSFCPRNFLLLVIVSSFIGTIALAEQNGQAWEKTIFSGGYAAVYCVWFLLFAWIGALSLLYFREKKWPELHWKALFKGGVTCGAVTFAAAIGTSNAIYINLVLNLGPWFCLLALMLLIIARLHAQALIYFAGVSAVGILAVVQIIAGAFSPFDLKADMFHQTVLTQVGFPVTPLKLDSETSRFCIDLRKLFYQNGFRPGDDVLAFYRMPSIIYIIGGRSPGTPWYLGSIVEGGNAYDDIYLSLCSVERLKKAFIIEDETCAPDHPNLRRYGLDFPGSYTLCGSLVIPQDQRKIFIWKPN